MGEKIQPDMGADAEFVPAVVPWFQIFVREKRPGDPFAEEDQQGVEAATKRKPYLAGDAVQRPEEGGAAVYGKHPEGGRSPQLEIAPL